MLKCLPGFVKKNLRFVFPLDFRDHSDWNVNSKFILCLYQVRPKLPLLKILQAAGAQGEMFTVKKLSLWYAKKESCHISYCYYRCCSDSRYRTGAQYGYSKSRPPEGKITTRWLLLLYRVAPSLYLWSWTPKTFPECGKSLIRKVLGSSKTRDRANLLCSAHYRVPVSESFFGM